jgi:hypothetical protein
MRWQMKRDQSEHNPKSRKSLNCGLSEALFSIADDADPVAANGAGLSA